MFTIAKEVAIEYHVSVAKRIVDAFPEVKAVYLDGSFSTWKGEPTGRAYMKHDIENMSHDLLAFTVDLEKEIESKGYIACIDLAYGEFSDKD